MGGRELSYLVTTFRLNSRIYKFDFSDANPSDLMLLRSETLYSTRFYVHSRDRSANRIKILIRYFNVQPDAIIIARFKRAD